MFVFRKDVAGWLVISLAKECWPGSWDNEANLAEAALADPGSVRTTTALAPTLA